MGLRLQKESLTRTYTDIITEIMSITTPLVYMQFSYSIIGYDSTVDPTVERLKKNIKDKYLKSDILRDDIYACMVSTIPSTGETVINVQLLLYYRNRDYIVYCSEILEYLSTVDIRKLSYRISLNYIDINVPFLFSSNNRDMIFKLLTDWSRRYDTMASIYDIPKYYQIYN